MTSSENSYKRPSNSDVLELVHYFEEEIEYFIHYVLGYSNNVEYSVCGLDIIDIITRTDKRLHYFHVFHDMDVNECKKAALFAYWIVKFRPIKIINDKYKNKIGYNNEINELFAIHILISILAGIGRIEQFDGTSGIDITMDNPYIKKLCYSFRFRNFTIDSMIVLADTITTDAFKAKPSCFLT